MPLACCWRSASSSLALALVALVGVRGAGGLKTDVDDLARDVRALAVAGEAGRRFEAISFITSQHLYVCDGDLEPEDRLQRRIERLGQENARAASRSSTA